MSLVRGSVVAAFTIVFFFGANSAVRSQSLTAMGMDGPSNKLRRCGEIQPYRFKEHEGAFSILEARDAKNSCESFASGGDAPLHHAEVNVAPSEEKLPGDPVHEELMSMGQSGMDIARARQAVIGILEGSNACTAWFQQSEPDPAQLFRTIFFHLDENGSKYVLKLQRESGEWFFRQPYAASVVQNGRSAAVTINFNGAFFHLRGIIHTIFRDNTPGGIGISKILSIDVYPGNTLEAQIAILLHEFAHVVHAIPDDAGSVYSELSVQNTTKVLRYCRSEVESAAKYERHLATHQPEALSNLWKH